MNNSHRNDVGRAIFTINSTTAPPSPAGSRPQRGYRFQSAYRSDIDARPRTATGFLKHGIDTAEDTLTIGHAHLRAKALGGFRTGHRRERG